MINDLVKFGKVKENVDLKNYNTYKVSCISRYLVDVKKAKIVYTRDYYKEFLTHILEMLKMKNHLLI